MKNTDFTPGPWHYRNQDAGAPILRIFCIDGDHPAKESRSYLAKEANAKLMAAAPELLEALVLLERKYASIADYADLPTDKEAVHKAVAAIQKATA